MQRGRLKNLRILDRIASIAACEEILLSWLRRLRLRIGTGESIIYFLETVSGVGDLLRPEGKSSIFELAAVLPRGQSQRMEYKELLGTCSEVIVDVAYVSLVVRYLWNVKLC